jgi:hypothetical protein
LDYRELLSFVGHALESILGVLVILTHLIPNFG